MFDGGGDYIEENHHSWAGFPFCAELSLVNTCPVGVGGYLLSERSHQILPGDYLQTDKATKRLLWGKSNMEMAHLNMWELTCWVKCGAGNRILETMHLVHLHTPHPRGHNVKARDAHHFPLSRQKPGVQRMHVIPSGMRQSQYHSQVFSFACFCFFPLRYGLFPVRVFCVDKKGMNTLCFCYLLLLKENM